MRGLTCSEVTEDALIERYISGQLSEDEFEALESHYLHCARCYDELRLAIAIRETLPEVADIDIGRLRVLEAGIAQALDATGAGKSRVAPTGRRHTRRLGVGAAVATAAAAVLAGVLLWTPRVEEPSPPHRAPPITAAPAPQAVRPVGTVADAKSLRWTAVSGADLYRATLFDADGEVLFETELAGTEAVLPDSVLLAPDKTYWWSVDARLGFGRWVASELIEFSVARGPRR
ncbi:MAG: hypothetical protein PVI01_02375 [Gemmatimonadales bacterium]